MMGMMGMRRIAAAQQQHRLAVMAVAPTVLGRHRCGHGGVVGDGREAHRLVQRGQFGERQAIQRVAAAIVPQEGDDPPRQTEALEAVQHVHATQLALAVGDGNHAADSRRHAVNSGDGDQVR